MRFFFKIILIFLINVNTSYSEILRVFEFTEDELKTLKTKKVKGETKWSLGSNENGNFIRAEAGSEVSIQKVMLLK